MSDYIKREDAINKFIKMSAGNVLDDHVLALNEIPPADVVEVVRCKDCKNRVDSQLTDCKEPNFCMRLACYANDNDFCSYGERKDEGL